MLTLEGAQATNWPQGPRSTKYCGTSKDAAVCRPMGNRVRTGKSTGVTTVRALHMTSLEDAARIEG